MKPLAALLLLLPLAAADACADSRADAASDCSAPPAVAIATLAALPAAVRTLLDADDTGIGGVAEADQAFTASDAVFGKLRPMRRFRTAGAGADCYAVTLEYGGIAHYFQTTIVRRTAGAWRIAGTRMPTAAELAESSSSSAPVQPPQKVRAQ